ncbi:MAG TPA: hypothetical protein PKI20_16065 [Verrucomicrobiota bacterium]|nr:hypothetical protein [Verrucomicrobiota bacterium]HQL79284.1 hypothetical protein [Verrucomicrobiota bacterium]
MKGEADLKALVKQRTWDKEVLVWLGTEKSLIGALGSAKHVVLDLLDLFQPDSLPPDDDTTKDAIHGQLCQRLRAIPKGPDNRTVLVVKSIGLLARYKVGLKDFYDWFVGSHTVVALLLEGTVEKTDWPDEVKCDTKRLLDYFNEPGMVKEVYGG